jgi:hypothetical protein
MAKKREPIDDMIDAHVWMRRQEVRLNRRSLTLDGVPDELPAENRPPRKPRRLSATNHEPLTRRDIRVLPDFALRCSIRASISLSVTQ